MAVSRLNHAVLYVRSVAKSVEFYQQVLDFKVLFSFPGAAFLQAPASNNDHDLGLFEIGEKAGASSAGRSTVGLYHIAWEVETLADLEMIAERLQERGALVGASDHGTTKAIYAKDPDGIEFEVSWLVPAQLIGDVELQGRKSIRPLDLEREKRRFGASTRGGVGVSFPAAAPVQ